MADAGHEEDQPVERPIYICASCTAEVTLEPLGRLHCGNCTNITGSSCVFYKKRVEPTTYDTV